MVVGSRLNAKMCMTCSSFRVGAATPRNEETQASLLSGNCKFVGSAKSKKWVRKFTHTLTLLLHQ